MTAGGWAAKVSSLLAGFPAAAAAWRTADHDTVTNTVNGVSLYSSAKKNPKPDAGARVVFNIASTHVPDFVAGPSGRAYLNRYDVAKAGRLGSPPGGPDARYRIDEALGAVAGAKYEDIYYGAVELNGAGVRYYGDMALVLRTDAVDRGSLILDRNSFDLISKPLCDVCSPNGSWSRAAAQRVLDDIAGQWDSDLADMAACKVLPTALHENRRITIGTVSDGILTDEDYIEVIRTRSFDVDDVAEVRVAAADAAVEGRVADRVYRGPAPDLAEYLWRHRRRKADTALRSKRVRTRIVVSSGRVRT